MTIDDRIAESESELAKLERLLELQRRIVELRATLLDSSGIDPEIVEDVLQAVTAVYKQTKLHILSSLRCEPLCTARHVAIYLLRTRTGASLHTIGRIFYRDHTTVHHAVRSVEDRLSTDPHFRNAVNAVIRQLKHPALIRSYDHETTPLPHVQTVARCG